MRVDLKYLMRDRDRHGNERIYVRRRKGGRKIRVLEKPGTEAFMEAYSAALRQLDPVVADQKESRRKRSSGLNEHTVLDVEKGSGDGLIDLMRRYNIPITREKYLELAYLGDPPMELSAEEEANLPAILRRLA
jgi:hypothetical protein